MESNSKLDTSMREDLKLKWSPVGGCTNLVDWMNNNIYYPRIILGYEEIILTTHLVTVFLRASTRSISWFNGQPDKW